MRFLQKLDKIIKAGAIDPREDHGRTVNGELAYGKRVPSIVADSLILDLSDILDYYLVAENEHTGVLTHNFLYHLIP